MQRRTVLALAGCLLSAVVTEASVINRVSENYACRGGDDASEAATVSADGRIVAFTTFAKNLVPGESRYSLQFWSPGSFKDIDVLVRDRSTRVIENASRPPGFGPDSASIRAAFPTLSADGSVVAWDIFYPSDEQVWVRDASHTVHLVSVDVNGFAGMGTSEQPSVSGDGRYVAFTSVAPNLVVEDQNALSDVFVRISQTGTTTRVSVDSGGVPGDANSFAPSISRDGRFVAFDSDADNLVSGDGNGVTDVFVHDRLTGVTTRVSVDSTGAEGNAKCAPEAPDLSDDGHLVAFTSAASNLIAGDANGATDVFVHDLATGTTTCASVAPGGTPGNGFSFGAKLSGDGSRVLFGSAATNLVADDGNGKWDVFVRDLTSGVTTLVSRTPGGAPANGHSEPADLSDDGHVIVFTSIATDLVAADDNGALADTFVYDEDCPGPGCPTACTYAPCQGGVATIHPKLVLSRLGPDVGGTGDESLVVKGQLPFPPGTPTLDLATTGAQIIVEDLASQPAARAYFLYDASSFTTPIPPAGGECGPRDGWRVNSSHTSWSYKNTSGALPAAGCAPGSAHGLQRVTFQDTRARTGVIKFAATVRNTFLATPRGPYHATVVLGGPAEGTSGACGAADMAAPSCAFLTGGLGLVTGVRCR